MSTSTVTDLGPLGVWSYQLDVLPMAQSRDVAAELDDLGFGALWVPEAFAREPFASAALLLEATRSMTVATGIASLHARTAMTMNAGWRTLTEAFGERFLLGIGVSHQPLVEGTHRSPYSAKPYSGMVEYLDQMDASVFAGAQPTVAPRRLLAALGPRMLGLAARRASGAHTYFVPVEHTAAARDCIGADAFLAPAQTVLFETDSTRARAVARGFMARYLALPNYTNNLRRLGYTDDDLAHGGSDRLVDAIVAHGDVADIATRVQQHLDAGADHVAVQVLCEDAPGLPLAQWRDLATITDSLTPRSIRHLTKVTS
ncbi:LLM class F420-dependent oxidoreductase [Gordonia spumicola]|uniref:LLM class F420-dependent oxidoreductase n=1 Tax=Gordonia spumicola TaxID=589161 RepID=A0A7I9V8P8_9ACTN|nr:LLM class F420-dependent oxidoreductase [Gordonia spumicola]GEE01697.1 LLM class F420-dependent oxidoreductase [Gordonia spumicola]